MYGCSGGKIIDILKRATIVCGNGLRKNTKGIYIILTNILDNLF